MRKRIEKPKFKNQIYTYSVLIVLLIIFTLFYFSVSIDKIRTQYRNSYDLYENIGGFYEQKALAHEYFRSFLYTRNSEEYRLYEDAIHEAKYNLHVMQENDSIISIHWRIDLLENMVESYEDAVQEFAIIGYEQNQKFKDAYVLLCDIHDSILKTSDETYQMVTTALDRSICEINESQKQMVFITSVIVVFSIIGVVSYAWFIQKGITRPIEELATNMNEIRKGSYNFEQVSIENQEIEVLCYALQDLSKSITKNIEHQKEKSELKNKLLLKENENLRKDELLATSELKILQNQMNPHFLFNAMNMIYQQAILEQASTTKQMIEKMTECLRYTLSQNFRSSTMDMELTFVENYIYIQNKRFEGRIQFELVCDNKIPNIRIPSMIIEPLIDNAIKHGLANTEENGFVSIHVTYQDGRILIHVSDNGCGMDEESLEKLIMNDFLTQNDGENIGLHNMKRRLMMYFGGNVNISVNSVEDCGFETIVSIPVEQGKEMRNLYDFDTNSRR